MKYIIPYILMASLLLSGEVDDAVAGLGSSDPAIRKSSAVLLGKSNSVAATQALASAMTDSDPGVREAACVSFWEQPRPYSVPVIAQVLMTAKLPDPVVRQYVVENLNLILSVLVQRNMQVPNRPMVAQNPFRAALLPDELQLVEQMFETTDRKLLRHLMGCFGMIQPKVDPALIASWVSQEDDSISLMAFNMGLPIETLLPLVFKRWDAASETWQIQCLQTFGTHPVMRDWLRTKALTPNVSELALTLSELQPPVTVEKFRALRKRLTSPIAVQRWVRSLPMLQKEGLSLALEVLESDDIAIATVIEIWGMYQIPLPPETALRLLRDRRRSVRQFASNFIGNPPEEKIKALCQSEWLDVRLLGINRSNLAGLEDYLIDDNTDVRNQAINRWLMLAPASQVPAATIAKVLNYGLNDPLCQDSVIMVAVNRPELASLLEAWAATPERKAKIQSAKPPPPPPQVLIAPVGVPPVKP